MSPINVRVCLRRAYEEIEDVRENVPISESSGIRLAGIAEQLRYLAEGGKMDPETVVGPDPYTLETIGDHLAEVIAETEDEAAMRLERARNEVMLATSVLEDRQEKQRKVRNDPS